MNKSHHHAAAEPDSAPQKQVRSTQTLFLWAALAFSALALAAMAVFIFGQPLWATEWELHKIPFDGAKAYAYLKQLCDIGPRPSGSEAMTKQQKLLEEHFKKCGAKVELQRFEADYPKDGPDANMLGHKVPMANIIVRWNPEKTERIMLCSHYDTLPWPFRDRKDPHGRFVGANDNGGGVAILMALADQYAKEPPKAGVDFVLFDGEEFMFKENDEDKFFLGAKYFANDYARHPPGFRYRWAVLMDMVSGTDLNLPEDLLSVTWDDSRPLVEDIWATAARLGVREFVKRPSSGGTDDHVPLHEGGIPACDLIDFSYPQWHTQDDTPEHCSALSMAKVGWVLSEWVKKQ